MNTLLRIRVLPRDRGSRLARRRFLSGLAGPSCKARRVFEEPGDRDRQAKH